MLRFLHGLEYDVDLVETKIVSHVEFMREHDYWVVNEDRIPNIVKKNILLVYREDMYERP